MWSLRCCRKLSNNSRGMVEHCVKCVVALAWYLCDARCAGTPHIPPAPKHEKRMQTTTQLSILGGKLSLPNVGGATEQATFLEENNDTTKHVLKPVWKWVRVSNGAESQLLPADMGKYL